MLTLVIGGAGSGKSAFAEDLVCRLGENRIYLAAMLPRGAEAQARIERHRARFMLQIREIVRISAEFAFVVEFHKNAPSSISSMFLHVLCICTSHMIYCHGTLFDGTIK